MKRILLFRYYHQFERNKNLLKFYKFLNPNVDIYGIYGGNEDKFEEANNCFRDILVHNYLIVGKSNGWKWKNDDITYQLWYNDYGHQIDFDIAHSVEWDLLFFEPFDTIYSHIPQNYIGVTGLNKYKNLKKKWYWLNDPKCHEEWKQMIEYFAKNYKFNGKFYGTLGPGISIPKAFFEKIKDINIPEISLGELRIPVLAQIADVPMKNTGLFKKWYSKKEYQVFNCMNKDIDIDIIKNNLKMSLGRRAFHPYRSEVTFDSLMALYHLIPNTKKNNISILFNKFKPLYDFKIR